MAAEPRTEMKVRCYKYLKILWGKQIKKKSEFNNYVYHFLADRYWPRLSLGFNFLELYTTDSNHNIKYRLQPRAAAAGF